MKLVVEDYRGDQAIYTNVNSFDFDGESGKLMVWYNDEPLTMYVSENIKGVAIKREVII